MRGGWICGLLRAEGTDCTLCAHGSAKQPTYYCATVQTFSFIVKKGMRAKWEVLHGNALVYRRM